MSLEQPGLFGLETSYEQASMVLIPVPWDLTTSYGGGTAKGPSAILQASPQIDLFDRDFGEVYRTGLHLLNIPIDLLELSKKLRPSSLEIRQSLEESEGVLSEKNKASLLEINQACEKMVQWVYQQAQKIRKDGKKACLVGGDHSTPYGLIKELSESQTEDFGILHIDAHADLRVAYQGFEHSHASIMNNVMNLARPPAGLCQIGIRDFCKEELGQIEGDPRIHTFFDSDLKAQLFEGKNWSKLCEEFLLSLPQNIYISMDIDGLSPEFCPHTGTPVPGGLSFDQVAYLLVAISKSDKKVIGFDLNEVAPDPNSQSEWDGNVGSRLLYKLFGTFAGSQVD